VDEQTKRIIEAESKGDFIKKKRAQGLTDFLRKECDREEPLSLENMRLLVCMLDPASKSGRRKEDPQREGLAWHAGNLRALFQYGKYPKTRKMGEGWKDFLRRKAKPGVCNSTIDRATKLHKYVYQTAYLYRTFRLWLDGKIEKIDTNPGGGKGKIPPEIIESAILFFPYEAGYHIGKITDEQKDAIMKELKKVV